MNSNRTLISAAVLACVPVTFVAVLGGPLVIGCTIGLVILVSLLAIAKQWVPPTLAVVALPFIRPNILGEQYSFIGVGLLLFAAVLALIQDGPNVKFLRPNFRFVRGVVFWVAVAYLWLAVRAAVLGQANVQDLVVGAAIMLLSLSAIAIVVSDSHRCLRTLRMVVGLTLALAASYLVTGVLWAVLGQGFGLIGAVQVGAITTPQPVYFPFTTTASTQPFFNLNLPRFTGLGREPGWMGMYLGASYFLLKPLSWDKLWIKAVLIIGLLGTISTAGFGAFIFAFALNFMLNGPRRSQFNASIRFVTGVISLIGAVTLAYLAPVLGFAAKSTQNLVSATERSQATQAGIDALFENPFAGGHGAAAIGAVSLIAAIAAYGLPFSLLITVALLRPIRGLASARLVLPFLSVIAITILVAQPPLDSIWAYGLLILGTVAIHFSPTKGDGEMQAMRPTLHHGPSYAIN